MRFAAEPRGIQRQLSQSVEPPPSDQVCFGMRPCGGGRRYALTRLASATSRTSSQQLLTTKPVSRHSEHARLQATCLSFGAAAIKVTASRSKLPPNPSLSTDPLRRAVLPVRRLGLCCTARASRPASAVGVSSNVRPHKQAACNFHSTPAHRGSRCSSPQCGSASPASFPFSPAGTASLRDFVHARHRTESGFE